jgi:hypothetical protein
MVRIGAAGRVVSGAGTMVSGWLKAMAGIMVFWVVRVRMVRAKMMVVAGKMVRDGGMVMAWVVARIYFLILAAIWVNFGKYG